MASRMPDSQPMNSRSGLVNVLKVDQTFIRHHIRDSFTLGIIIPGDFLQASLSPGKELLTSRTCSQWSGSSIVCELMECCACCQNISHNAAFDYEISL